MEHDWISQKIKWKERWHKQEQKNKFWAEHKLNWENALINSIGKGLFAGPNKVLVITLQDVCQIGSSQCCESSVIVLKQSDEACIIVRKNVNKGNQFFFPIMQYVTQYDLITDLNEDNSLTNITNFVVLCPALDESNYN